MGDFRKNTLRYPKKQGPAREYISTKKTYLKVHS